MKIQQSVNVITNEDYEFKTVPQNQVQDRPANWKCGAMVAPPLSETIKRLREEKKKRLEEQEKRENQ